MDRLSYINCVCVNSRICLRDFPKSDDYWMDNSTFLASLIERIPGTKDIILTGYSKYVHSSEPTMDFSLLAFEGLCRYATLFVQCASSLKLSL